MMTEAQLSSAQEKTRASGNRGFPEDETSLDLKIFTPVTSRVNLAMQNKESSVPRIILYSYVPMCVRFFLYLLVCDKSHPFNWKSVSGTTGLWIEYAIKHPTNGKICEGKVII